MCGIIGYIGSNAAVPVVIEGLRRLEYRGYDSAGVACVQRGELCITRAQGKLSALEEKLAKEPVSLGCVCKPSSRNRVTTGKCATMTSLKTSGSGLSPYCQQKVLLVEGDRLVTSETFSMLYIGCCEPDLHGELCQRNMVRGKPYIPDSGVGRKEDIWLLSLSFLPYRRNVILLRHFLTRSKNIVKLQLVMTSWQKFLRPLYVWLLHLSGFDKRFADTP